MRNLIICVTGKKWSGKSYFVKNSLVPKFKRVVVFDSQNEYSPPNDLDRFMNNEFTYSSNIDELVEAHRHFFNTRPFYHAFTTGDRSEIESGLEYLASFGYITLVLEEIHLYDQARQKGILYDIFTTGRHKHMNVIATYQRSASVSLDLRSAADVIISFGHEQSHDIEAAMKDDKVEGAKLPNLKQGEHVILRGREILSKYLQ